MNHTPSPLTSDDDERRPEEAAGAGGEHERAQQDQRDAVGCRGGRSRACRNGANKMPSSPSMRCGRIPAVASRPTASRLVEELDAAKRNGTTAHMATKARPSAA